MSFETVDWRRRVFELYSEVRAIDDPAAAHAHWCTVRDDLFAHHPASAILPEDRAGFRGLPVAAYDPAWRFVVEVQAAEPATFEFETGTDGLVTYVRLGVVEVPDVGTLDLWRHTGYGGGVFLPFRDTSSSTTSASRCVRHMNARSISASATQRYASCSSFNRTSAPAAASTANTGISSIESLGRK